jgi:hypothetical protein
LPVRALAGRLKLLFEKLIDQPARSQVRFAHVGFVVFLAGYFAFPNGWWHMVWFSLAVVLPLFFLRRPSWSVWERRVPFLLASVVFVLAMLAISLRPGTPRPSWLGWILTLLDIAFLLIFVRMAFRLGKRSSAVSKKAVIIMIHVAAVTAVVSLLVFYWLPGRVFPASRLENLFVYLGLAPVLTGILYGFAGLAAAILAIRESRPRMRGYLLSVEALLLFAALCSHTRGAVLALAAGFGVLVVTQFNRRVLPSLAVLVLVALVYQFALPQIGRLTSPEVPQASSNPTAKLVSRKDSGRLGLYQIILDRMRPPGDYLVGRGRWVNDTVGPPEMTWYAHHPHSIYLATFYRGGAVGVALLGIVIVMGLASCWRTRQASSSLWLALACFGLAALIFDGDDLMTMASMPRIEPLLFWFPLAAGVGAAARQNRATNS